MNVILQDYWLDEYKNLTKKQNVVFKSNTYLECLRMLKPPSEGFSLVAGRWHKPATCLFYNFKENKSYLFGQDSDVFFGVELQGNPDTVEDAFLDMQPEEVRLAKKFYRQGEWFCVPVKESNIPKNLDLLLNGRHETFDLVLPLEYGGNEHDMSCDAFWIAKDRSLYVLNPYISHTEHCDLHLSGHYKVLKNTVIRSVSQEGVD